MFATSKQYTVQEKQSRNRGSMIIMTLIFGAVFMMLASSLAGFVLVQKKSTRAKESREKAVQIAEAGLDRYRWYLGHYPNDQDGPTNSMPYTATYDDPELGLTGEYTITASSSSSCGEVQSMDIISEGHTDDAPDFKRTVSGRYARPSVAEYAYIINSNVWAGADRDIVGPYHSNGGIRMDGTNYSTVTSGQSTWLCTSSFGCSPNSTQQGIFGAGPNDELWSYPQPTIDFGAISVDLANMKTRAQSQGLYFARISGGNPRYGYHLVLKSNRSVDVYRVTNSDRIWSYTLEDGWKQRYEAITGQALVGNYAIPESCGLIFVEDRVWLEGVVRGKMSVAVADIGNPHSSDLILNNNVTYTTNDGSDGLTVVADNDVIIPLLSPEDMSIYGIFIAQNGHFGRNNYTSSGSQDVPAAYDGYVQQDDLIVHGTIVSNGREGTKWTSGGTFVSGYDDRFNTYDRNQAINPPPMTPYVSDDYTFIEWHEEN